MSCEKCLKQLSNKEKENFISYCHPCAHIMGIKSRKEMAKIKKSVWFNYYNTDTVGPCMICDIPIAKDYFECVTADHSNNYELTNVKIVCPSCVEKHKKMKNQIPTKHKQNKKTPQPGQHGQNNQGNQNNSNRRYDPQLNERKNNLPTAFVYRPPPFGYVSVFDNPIQQPVLNQSLGQSQDNIQLIPVWSSAKFPMMFPQWWYCQLYKLQQYPAPWYESYMSTTAQSPKNVGDPFGVAPMDVDWIPEH